MTSEFDRYEARYEELIGESIGFIRAEHAVFMRAKAHALIDLTRRWLGDPGELEAVDVGCGPGLLDRELGAFGELHGVDLSPGMIAHARRANPGVSYHVGDGTRLPFDGASFDVAFASCVLHHVPRGERDAFATELARVTRPGGLAVVFEHNPLNPLTRLAVARCAFDDDAILLSPRETSRLLERAGLRPAERRYIVFFPWRARLLAAAERALAPFPLGAQYYVAAHA